MPMPQGMPQGQQMPPPGIFAQMASQLSPGSGGQPPSPAMTPDANIVSANGKRAIGALQNGAPLNAQIMQALDAYVGMFGQPARQELNSIMMQRMSAQGRNGDTTVAHLTPGEKTVPPEVQTPKVLATLNKAYRDKGVSPQQFTVGSPTSSKNPATGLPEYNFISAFLPAALGLAGSIAMPYLAPELMSAATASAVGGGAGTALGSLAAGKTPTQAALSGLGAGVGGYAMGNIGNGLSAMGNQTAQAAGQAGAQAGQAGAQAAQSAMPSVLPSTAGSSPSWQNLWGMSKTPMNIPGMIGSTAGGAIGDMIGAPPKPTSPNYPPGFNTPMTSLDKLPSAQTQLGQNISKQPMPSFSGFNPQNNYPGAYNFFPTANNGM